jgi:hypothetical protein
MSAPPKLCGFDLLPLQDFHLMVSWVPPGITKPLQRTVGRRRPPAAERQGVLDGLT